MALQRLGYASVSESKKSAYHRDLLQATVQSAYVMILCRNAFSAMALRPSSYLVSRSGARARCLSSTS